MNRAVLQTSSAYRMTVAELKAIIEQLPPDAVFSFGGIDPTTGDALIGFEHDSFPKRIEGQRLPSINAHITKEEWVMVGTPRQKTVYTAKVKIDV